MASQAHTTRRFFLRATAAAPALAIPAALAAATDPIFALIDEHRLARAALDAIPIDVDEDRDPNFKAANEREFGAWHALMDGKPTTLSGIKAYAEYITACPGL